ncbi:MAG: class I SAM-dependent methyltransferase [Eubacteriales bacterium]|nr:class I SAM-dependent methyltransferase [Eubacteriales bacterium]
MSETKQNYYGSLCTEMYEILHEKAPQDELDFYLSYAEKGKKILEPLCGSGRFLVPFMERGFDISGLDLSTEMLAKLKQKAPDAKVVQGDMTQYACAEKFDYVFISSGSMSLFTDGNVCQAILRTLKSLLAPGGTFVFAVDTIADRSPDHDDYTVSISVKTKEGLDLILKSKSRYDEQSQTQFAPGVYELWRGEELLQSEPMDFQTHLYRLGEMEQHLKRAGFAEIAVYSTFEKELAADNRCEMFLYECR